MKFENVSRQKSGRSIVIDFQMINIHTGTYVMGRNARWIFHIVEGMLDLC
jgi:hypothetical protein